MNTLLLLASLSLAGAQSSAESPIGIGQLSSQSFLDRRVAYSSILSQRDELIAALLANVQNETPDLKWGSAYYYSIRLLGDLRAKEAVGALTVRLTYLPIGDEFSSEALPEEYYYPCAVALTRIGEPAIKAMLSAITTSRNDDEVRLASWVVLQIEGKKQAVHRLDDLVTEEPWLRAHYEVAKSHILSWKPVFRRPPQPENASRRGPYLRPCPPDLALQLNEQLKAAAADHPLTSAGEQQIRAAVLSLDVEHRWKTEDQYELLRRTGAAALTVIAEVLKSDDEATRTKGLAALGQLVLPREHITDAYARTEALLILLARRSLLDKSPANRQKAVAILGGIGSHRMPKVPEGVRIGLTDAMRSDADPQVRRWATRQLEDLGLLPPGEGRRGKEG